MGGIEGASRGAAPERASTFVHYGRGSHGPHPRDAATSGSRRKSGGLAHGATVCGDAAGALQPDAARDRGPGICSLLGGGVPAVSASRGRAVLDQTPVTYRAAAALDSLDALIWRPRSSY